MQVLVSLPQRGGMEEAGKYERRLFRRVCGVPLLTRVLATAARSGATSVLVLQPAALSQDRLQSLLRFPALSALPIRFHAMDRPFDPNDANHWQLIQGLLEEQFLWLPWNHVTVSSALEAVIAAGPAGEETRAAAPLGDSTGTEMTSETVPLKVSRQRVLAPGGAGWLRAASSSSRAEGAGIAVSSASTLRQAERLLLLHSGKPTDGAYSRLNRRLCRPLLRGISKTPITPNLISLASLPVAGFAAYCYSRGDWSASVAGGFLYFVSVLLDEMDGMLARVKFQESQLGRWIELAAHHLRYLFLFSGMALGLAREYGSLWLIVGGLALFGQAASFFLLVRSPDRSDVFHGRLHHRLGSSSTSRFSRVVGRMKFLARKGVASYYVLLFSALGLVAPFLLLCAVATNMIWVITIYTNGFLRSIAIDWSRGP
ncbi:MAG: CDP-alcohol phosphatidyltransferase family protein [Acidobacteriota bacterium]